MLLLADEGPPPPPPPPPPWPSISDRKSTRSSSQGTSQQILPAWQPPLSIPGRLPAQGSPGGRRLPSPSIGNPGGHHSQSPPRPLQSASASRFHENRSFPSSPLQSRCISERKLLSAVWRERERERSLHLSGSGDCIQRFPPPGEIITTTCGSKVCGDAINTRARIISDSVNF